MKRWICLLAALLAVTVRAGAAEFPRELLEAAPRETARMLEDLDLSPGTGIAEGLHRILDGLSHRVKDVVRQRVRGAAAVLLTVVLCGAVEGFRLGTGAEKTAVFLSMVGALSVTAATAGSLDSLLGLGAETIGELSEFSTVLLPTLAAATAAGGAVTTATVQQVSTVFLVDLLLRLIYGLLLPLVYLYIGVLTAGAMLPGGHLDAVAGGLKKAVTWLLTTALLAFTLYLSVVRVVTGAADGVTVKVAKAAISGVVPVVGGIIAEASETVLAGAGMLRSTIGAAGMLVILSACAYPFLQLGIQYLLYKLTAFLAGVIGAPGLCRLIDGLGGAFGLVLGMTGACALLLLVIGAPGLCRLIDGLGGAFGLVLGMTGACALLLLVSILASVGAVMP